MGGSRESCVDRRGFSGIGNSPPLESLLLLVALSRIYHAVSKDRHGDDAVLGLEQLIPRYH